MTEIKKAYKNSGTKVFKKRQWQNLNIVFISPLGVKIEIGEGTKYRIEKSEEVFNSLMLSPIDDRMYREREISVSVILTNMKDAKEISDFFVPNVAYTLNILADNTRYTTTARIHKTLSMTGIENLFGTNEKPSSIKIELISENGVFFEENAQRITQNSQSQDLFKYPYYLPKQDNDYFMFEVKMPQKMILINNMANEENGIEARVLSYSKMINPTFINETTGKSMTIECILEKGDVMEIDTGTVSAPYIKINNEMRYNLKRLFDKWFKVEKGPNMIRFATENKEENCELLIIYRNKYRGL